MAKRKPLRILLTEQSVQALALSLLMEAGAAPPPDPQLSPDEMDFLAASHFDDDMFIAYSMRTLEPDLRPKADQHLQVCRACAAEMSRIEDLSSIWAEESAIQRLESEIRSKPKIPGSRRLPDIFGWISLKPLLLPQVAFGEGKGEETVSIEFPIVDKGLRVEGVEGVLMRQNREFYVSIKETDVGGKLPFSNRQVVIRLSNPREARPLLERNVDVGVVVLLGTGLRVTEDTEMEARLLPASSE